MAMPLDTMLTRDTQAAAGFALAPWTRDVGQMVASPGDLYAMLERPMVQMHEKDGLVVSSAFLDNRAFSFADKRKDSKWLQRGVKAGNALPVATMGLSGVFAFDDSRPQLSDAGVAALEADAAAFGANWLYGVAALGYALGSIAWEARRDSRLGRNGPKIAVGANEVSAQWEFQ